MIKFESVHPLRVLTTAAAFPPQHLVSGQHLQTTQDDVNAVSGGESAQLPISVNRQLSYLPTWTASNVPLYNSIQQLSREATSTQWSNELVGRGQARNSF